MKMGDKFGRDGRVYEVMEAGLTYNSKNTKACLRPHGAKNSISIDEALKQQLICEAKPDAHQDQKPPDGMLPLSYDENHAVPSSRTKPPVKEDDKAASLDSLIGQAFFMPVAQVRAQVFLAHGLIYPAACDTSSGSPIADVQALAPDTLVLWRNQPPITKDEVLLKLLLTRAEASNIEQPGDPILWPTPLPISRLIQIAVPAKSPEDVAKYMHGWIEPDVPVPSTLFTMATEVAQKSVTAAAPLPSTKPPTKDAVAETKAITARYNRCLGLFAYMRNAARYHSSRLGMYADFPAQFFRLASRLDPALDLSNIPQVPSSQILESLIEDAPSLNPITEALRQLAMSTAVYIDKTTAQPVARAIQDAGPNTADISQAFKRLFDDDYREAIALLQKEPQSEPAILLAALYKFSDRQSNDHRNLKPTLHEDWTNIPTVATTLALLGAYYGYTALDARETRIYSMDKRLTAALDQRPPIKFHLETRFERELIESVYQWTFCHRHLDQTIKALFSSPVVFDPSRGTPPRQAYWKDESYKVGHVTVRSYRLTPLARLLQRVETLPTSTIDESTILGQYLMHACFFHAEEFEMSRKGGRERLHYRISKQRIIDLLADERIRVNAKVLLAALDEDSLGKK